MTLVVGLSSLVNPGMFRMCATESGEIASCLTRVRFKILWMRCRHSSDSISYSIVSV